MLVASRGTWRSIIASSVSTSFSMSVSISSDIDAASNSGAGCALSFPFFDATRVRAGVACFGLLDEGLSIPSSPNKPFCSPGRFAARSIMFGDDVVGVGAAKVSLQVSRGFRVGRRSSFVGSFACAFIIASNLQISEAMSFFISSLRTAPSACVNPYSGASTNYGWADGAGRFFSA